MKKNEIPTPQPNHQDASAAVTAALGTLSFPIEKKAAIRQVGDWKVPYTNDAKVSLGKILEAVPNERFEDVGQAVRAVDAHWGRVADLLTGAVEFEQKTMGAGRKVRKND